MSAYDAGHAQVTIRKTDEIARGSAGDCCILCGRVGIDLPLDHGCRPNIDVQAYRAQLSNAVNSSVTLHHALLYDRRKVA